MFTDEQPGARPTTDNLTWTPEGETSGCSSRTAWEFYDTSNFDSERCSPALKAGTTSRMREEEDIEGDLQVPRHLNFQEVPQDSRPFIPPPPNGSGFQLLTAAIDAQPEYEYLDAEGQFSDREEKSCSVVDATQLD